MLLFFTKTVVRLIAIGILVNATPVSLILVTLPTVTQLIITLPTLDTRMAEQMTHGLLKQTTVSA
jgi:hypothetical protein